MNIARRTSLVLAMAVAVASSTSGQSTSPPSTTRPTEATEAEPFSQKAAIAQQKAAIAEQKAALDAQGRARDAQLREAQSLLEARTFAAKPGAVSFFGSSGDYAAGSSDAPVLLVTAPMDKPTRDAWKEDMSVMYKLLRDAIETSGANAGSSAMGIRLQSLGRAAPLYVEDCGLIFRVSTNLPLASAGNQSTTQTGPTTRASAWELTRRQLSGEVDPNLVRKQWSSGGQPFALVERSIPFDQRRVDTMISAVIETLPEASHFRHLKPGEFIFVSISGTDDVGAPRRLTLKAKKSDIDDAASAKLKPEDFKRRVARNIDADTRETQTEQSTPAAR
jgi:hypothetical protein